MSRKIGIIVSKSQIYLICKNRKQFKLFEHTGDTADDIRKIVQEEKLGNKNQKLYIYIDDLTIDTMKQIPNNISIRYDKNKIIDEASYIVNKKKDMYNLEVQVDSTYNKENIILTVYSIRKILVDKIAKLCDEYNINLETIEAKESLLRKFYKGKQYSIIFAYNYDKLNKKIIDVYVYKKDMLITKRKLYYDLSKDNLEEELDRTLKYCTGIYHDFKYDEVYVINENWDGFEHYKKFNYKIIDNIKSSLDCFDKKSAVNFIPKSIKYMKVIIVVMILISIISIYIAANVVYIAHEKNTALEDVKQKNNIKTAQIKEVTKEEQKINVKIKENTVNTKGIEELKGSKVFWQGDFLRHIEHNIVSNVKLEAINQKDQTVEIKGQVKNLEDMKNFIANLESNEIISKVEIKGIDINLEAGITNFIINCYIK
ncbi:MAG: hypothetical protein A2Y18_00295 [Clostridiales bacterium GWD2_32_19]|nr:MAG: hypothetical protein A2Y18_00295 [Clostridiales bacterium GWD2_32_19]